LFEIFVFVSVESCASFNLSIRLDLFCDSLFDIASYSPVFTWYQSLGADFISFPLQSSLFIVRVRVSLRNLSSSAVRNLLIRVSIFLKPCLHILIFRVSIS
jgi:hypothetical protein